ncbi:MAG: UDP-2,3-diacylglucosamine diphosphatase LpxI domain-containing protein, partial [Terracidiphilus sp.]
VAEIRDSMDVADSADAAGTALGAAAEPASETSHESSLLARRLTIVKVAKPNQDMRFDVPVIGISTVETMIRAGASCLSIEAARTLLFDRDALLKRASEAGIAIVAARR